MNRGGQWSAFNSDDTSSNPRDIEIIFQNENPSKKRLELDIYKFQCVSTLCSQSYNSKLRL